MSVDWHSIILDTPSTEDAWKNIFAALLGIARDGGSPVDLHKQTVVPDRLLSGSSLGALGSLSAAGGAYFNSS